MMLGIFDENGSTVAVIVLTVASQEIYVVITFVMKKNNTLKCTANMHVLNIRKKSITWEL